METQKFQLISKFRELIIEQLKHSGFMSKKEAINSGAEYAQCSPVTITRYFDKMPCIYQLCRH